MRLLKNFSFQKIETLLFSLLILFFPTQFGKHFWPEFAFINGLRIDYLSPTFYFTDALVLLLLLLRLPYLLRTVFSKAALPFWLASFFLGVTVFTSNSIPNGIYALFKFFECACLFLYVTRAIPKVLSWERLTSLLAVGVIAESMLAIAQFVHQGSIGGMLYFLGERSFTASTPGIANASLNGELVMRTYGTFSHPNVLAGYLLTTMILIFFVMVPIKKTLIKMLASLALLLGTIGLVLTLSRIAILLWSGFIIASFVWQLIQNRFGKSQMHVSIGLVTLIAIGVLFSQILLPRFLQTALTDESVTQRQILIESSFAMMKQHPLAGVGLGGFLPRLADIQSPLSLGVTLQPVHNIFLLVAAETGLIGVGLFLWLLGNSYRRLIRISRRQKDAAMRSMALGICISVIVITGFFDHYWLTLQQGQLLLVFIVGLVWN